MYKNAKKSYRKKYQSHCKLIYNVIVRNCDLWCSQHVANSGEAVCPLVDK